MSMSRSSTFFLALLALMACQTADDDSDDLPGETGVALCSDGMDNDGDGHVDCDDVGCARVGVCTDAGAGGVGGGGQGGGAGGAGGGVVPGGIGQESTDELCSNGLDDDGDGRIDCGDRHCTYTRR
ncbi:MAG: hypothetical protein R3F43_07940 [bacterium]